MSQEWPLRHGLIVAIEETIEGNPDSGVYQVNPKTRKLAKPKKLQAFEISGHTHSGYSLSLSDKEPELYLRMNGGWRIR